MNFYDRLRWCEKRHHHWCKTLEQYIETRQVDTALHVSLGYDWPSVGFSNKATKVAGEYSRNLHRCTYHLPYLFMLGDKYDVTIAHECVHAYQQKAFPGCQWHGDFFLYLLRVVCGFTAAETRHSNYRPVVLHNLREAYRIHAAKNPPSDERWQLYD